ncbi:MAG: hypothetical protein R6X08_06020, partial [Desulfosalsimonadaceae bacterium]
SSLTCSMVSATSIPWVFSMQATVFEANSKQQGFPMAFVQPLPPESTPELAETKKSIFSLLDHFGRG